MIIQILSWSINLSQKWFNWRLKRAIKKAKRESKFFNKKYMVIALAGKPRVYQKASLKELIKKRGYFKKGTTVEQLEKMAYYITN